MLNYYKFHWIDKTKAQRGQIGFETISKINYDHLKVAAVRPSVVSWFLTVFEIHTLNLNWDIIDIGHGVSTPFSEFWPKPFEQNCLNYLITMWRSYKDFGRWGWGYWGINFVQPQLFLISSYIIWDTLVEGCVKGFKGE